MKKIISYLYKMFLFSPKKIICVWVLDFIFSGILLATPMVIGNAIDGLLDGSYFWFSVLLALLFFEAIAGYLYRWWDTRIYERITADFKTKYFSAAIASNIGSSEIDANIELVEEFSDFLQFFAIKIMTMAGLIFPLYYLYSSASIVVMLIAIGVVAIIFLLQIFFQLGMQTDITAIRDENEKRHDIIRKRNVLHYKQYLDKTMNLTISFSDKDAIAFSVPSLFQLGLLAFSVWYIVSSDIATAGVIYATITYIIKLNESAFEIPDIYADCLRIKDGMTRLSRSYTD